MPSPIDCCSCSEENGRRGTLLYPVNGFLFFAVCCFSGRKLLLFSDANIDTFGHSQCDSRTAQSSTPCITRVGTRNEDLTHELQLLVCIALCAARLIENDGLACAVNECVQRVLHSPPQTPMLRRLERRALSSSSCGGHSHVARRTLARRTQAQFLWQR